MSENSDRLFEGAKGSRAKALLSDWPTDPANNSPTDPPANNSALRRELLTDMPLNNDPKKELKSAAPDSGRTSALIPQFWEVNDKFDYDKSRGLSKEEVQRAAADPSFKPNERKMAQLLNDNYDVIKPLGLPTLFGPDGLRMSHLRDLDSLTKDGITNTMAFNYFSSAADPYFWTGNVISLSSFIGWALMPNGLSRKVAGRGGALIGLGLISYGIGKGVYDYYDAKPKLEGISREVGKMSKE